ncbi:hypothetical protein C8J57DRAFT_1258702 [Mycena rebaudengoi]|nr:hypothetical protein C8J57DRAFT_1258702 [Mycena rebaudengoi]
MDLTPLVVISAMLVFCFIPLSIWYIATTISPSLARTRMALSPSLLPIYARDRYYESRIRTVLHAMQAPYVEIPRQSYYSLLVQAPPLAFQHSGSPHSRRNASDAQSAITLRDVLVGIGNMNSGPFIYPGPVTSTR